MRCSRRRGVILYKYFSNGCFAAYTSPPPTAEPLLKERPFGGHFVQLSLVAELVRHTQSTPPWHADAIGAGWRSQPKGEKRRADWAKLASDQAAQGFHLPRSLLASPAFQFYSLDFHVTHRFFVSFLTQERNVLPRPPSSPSSLSNCNNSAIIIYIFAML